MALTKTQKNLRRMTLSAMMLALAYLLPFLTAQDQSLGNMLLPMHIPVMLCGFLCGGGWGFAVGLVVPLLRSVTLVTPPLFPVALAMSLELATYGFMCGFMNRFIDKQILRINFAAEKVKPFISLYASLIAAMLCGRVVWGCAMYLMLMAKGGAFTFTAFLTGAFAAALPGIIIQLVLIPAAVVLSRKSNLISQLY